MTDRRSPRLKPSAARPRAKSRTWSWYSLHEYDCQMPRSFSRTAVRVGRSAALRRSRRGSVAGSATARTAFWIAEVRLDDGGVGPHLVRRALRDLLAHVQHCD